MERFKKFIGLVCLIGLMGFRSGVAGGAEITLRYAGNLPVTHHVTKGQELFAKLMQEKTRGRVEVQVFPAGQLFSDKDMMKAVPSGAVDMAEVTINQWTGLVPGFLIMDLPLFFKERAHFWRTLDGGAGEIIKNDLERVGVKFLHWLDYGWIDLISKKPVKTLEDFKGMRIRCYGELVVESTKCLGAAPTFMGGGEVYMALQRGTIDGAWSGPTGVWERKQYEVAKHMTEAHWAFTTFAVLMNLKKWKELPPDIQKVVLDCSEEAQKWTRQECEKMDKQCLEFVKQKGMEVYVLPENERERWKKATEPVYKIVSDRIGEKSKLLLELAEKAR